MATDIVYSMGQYRYAGSGCMTRISDIGISTPDLSSSNYSYRDLLCTLNGENETFQANTDYFFRISIPRDKNYAMTLDVKLVNSTYYTSGKYVVEGSSNYQLLGSITIPAETQDSEINIIRVAYYENSEGKGVLSEVLVYDENVTPVKDQLYVQTTAAGNVYYLGQPDNTDNPYLVWTKVSYTTLSTIFSSSTSAEKYATLEYVFRPGTEYDSGYPMNAIWLNIERSAIDYSISQEIVDGNSKVIIPGRYISPDQITSVECYKLANLIDSFNITTSSDDITPVISKIGVWGNPGLKMAINGESMRIGPSGLFSFDALDITSIGIVAANNDYNDMFTIDYEYEKTATQISG
jgi:hypothetical protein